MAINLSKGQNAIIDSSMKMALVGLGWDANNFNGSAPYDLDVSCFLLGTNGKVLNDEQDFVFYNNLIGRNGAVIHQGDNVDGQGDGDDEVILINFSKMPSEIERLVITVTIHDAEIRRQSFGNVSNSYVRVAKIQSESDLDGETVIQFDLEEEFSTETGLVACEIYRQDGDWKFRALANGYQGGLEVFCRNYGISV